MSVLPSPVTHRGWRRLREIAADLLIATALIWTRPLLLGAMKAVVRIRGSGGEMPTTKKPRPNLNAGDWPSETRRRLQNPLAVRR